MSDAGRLNSLNFSVLVTAIAVAWIALHQVNALWSETLAWSAGVTWLYLPAAIRPVAILLFGVPGAVGLFVGSLFTMSLFTEAPVERVVAVAAMSALAPLIAVTWVLGLFKLPRDLGGLTARQLLAMVVASAALSVCLHNLYYWGADLHDDLFSGLLPMFIGDVLGTLVVLYAARAVLRLVARLRARRTR